MRRGPEVYAFSPSRPGPLVFRSERWAALAALAAVVLAGGCDLSRVAMAAEEGPSFTLVALPDTQYYASAHPGILEAQAQWILEHQNDDRIAVVVHEGDIVDADEARQWEPAARSLHRLDGRVPYVLSAGNHDYRRAGSVITRETSMDRYFPAAGFSGHPRSNRPRNPWTATGSLEQSSSSPDANLGFGTFEPGRIEDSFRVIDAPGGPWLILSLEFGPRDEVLAWAGAVAKQHAALPAMVVTHAYLSSDGTRYDHRTRTDQPWNPHVYLRDTGRGEVNDGEEIWRKLVSTNDNILFVLCGHDLGDGVARLTSVRRDGTKVHQLLANYQMDALGGEGFLRLMRFFPAERRVVVRTYSPYADRFKTDPDNDFTVEY
jgi:hypothetical protein